MREVHQEDGDIWICLQVLLCRVLQSPQDARGPLLRDRLHKFGEEAAEARKPCGFIKENRRYLNSLRAQLISIAHCLVIAWPHEDGE